jgi:hypothetical protein
LEANGASAHTSHQPASGESPKFSNIEHDCTLSNRNFILKMKKSKNLGFEPVYPKNVLLASVVHGISCLFNIYYAVLFLGPIRFSKLKSLTFLVGICMGRMSNFETLNSFFVPEPQHSYQKCRQI